MKVNKVHCLFEQSGTFKNELIKLGIPAEDYDIQNEFGETDHIVDLFAEIQGGYNGEPSIFDNMKAGDLVLSFFPCVRFEAQVLLYFRGDNFSQKGWSMREKLKYDLDLHEELALMYKLVTMLSIICLDRGLKMIMENPYSEQHYLRRYWCLPAQLIDMDRREKGDYFKKPTQYWFLNCEPAFNFIFEPQDWNAAECTIANMKSEAYEKMGAESAKTARSMIHPDYARRFIREYVLDQEDI